MRRRMVTIEVTESPQHECRFCDNVIKKKLNDHVAMGKPLRFLDRARLYKRQPYYIDINTSLELYVCEQVSVPWIILVL